MIVRRPGESEADFIDRRGRDYAEWSRRHDAAIEAHRLAGTLKPCALLPGPDIEFMPRGGTWS